MSLPAMMLNQLQQERRLTRKSVKKEEAGSGSLVRSGSATAPSAVGAAGGLSQSVASASSTHCSLQNGSYECEQS